MPALAPRHFLIIGVLAVVTLLLALAPRAVASRTRDCAECHAAVASAPQPASHAGLECRHCHTPRSAAGRVGFEASVIFGMRLRLVDIQGRAVSEVPNSRCQRCHQQGTSGEVLGDSLRIKHSTCAKRERCAKCHVSEVHGLKARPTKSMDMAECLTCHNRMGETQACDACHAGKVRADRVKKGTFAVTHGSEWRKTHGLGHMLTCTTCHQAKDCGKCHGAGVPHPASFQTKHSQVAQDPAANCDSCHAKRFCDACHGVPMPHTLAFKKQHSKVADQKGEATCQRCHAKEDCRLCHIKHVHPGGAIGTGPTR